MNDGPNGSLLIALCRWNFSYKENKNNFWYLHQLPTQWDFAYNPTLRRYLSFQEAEPSHPRAEQTIRLIFSDFIRGNKILNKTV